MIFSLRIRSIAILSVTERHLKRTKTALSISIFKRMNQKDTGQTGFLFWETDSICFCGYTVRRIRYSTTIGQLRPLESDRELPRTMIIRKFTSIQHFWKKHLFCMSLTSEAVFEPPLFFCNFTRKCPKTA